MAEPRRRLSVPVEDKPVFSQKYPYEAIALGGFFVKYQECLDEARTSPALAYFLHGEEVFLHEGFIAAVKEALFPNGDDLLNCHHFEGSDEGLLAASEALGTVPFMAPYRLVVVGDGPVFGAATGKADAGKAGLDSLVTYLRNPSRTSRLIISAPRKDVMSNSAFKALSGLSRVVLCGALKGRALEDWIRTRFKSKGVTPSRTAVALLSHFRADGLLALENEIEKACLHSGSDRVEEEDVRDVASWGSELGIFDLMDALGLKDTMKALAALNGLLGDGVQHGFIINMMARHVRHLIRARDLGGSASQVASATGVQVFVAERYIRQARNFSMEQLEGFMGLLLELDVGLKTGAATDEAMYLLVFRVTGA